MDFILTGLQTAFLLLLRGDPQTYSAIIATLQVTTYSMCISLTVGIPAGFALGYFDFRGKRQLRFVADTLMALPTVFIGLMVYALLSNSGPLGGLGLLFTLPGIALGQSILALPIVIALCASAVEATDRQLRLALISLGADRRQLFAGILREVRFGILSAAINAYGRVLTEVGISLMVGGNIKWHTRTITTAIALETSKGLFSMGIALGLVLILIAFGVNLSLWFLRRQ
ncbi:MAG: ABC transporter permease [Thermodesulfobacteriota bacterium]